MAKALAFLLMGTVIVLAKSPVPGMVKTRLGPPCTPLEAARIAEASLVDTLAAVAASSAVRRVLVLDGPTGPWLDSTLGFEVTTQRTGGLDRRLADAFDDVLGVEPSNPSEACVLIAMDTPHVLSHQVDGAIAALHTADAVLGLADDGGYWLVGLRRPDREAFEGVPMSTDRTGAQQLSRLQARYATVAMIEPMRDIDACIDLDWLCERHPHLRTSQAWQAIRAAHG